MVWHPTATPAGKAWHKLLVEETAKVLISNKVRFNESFFPRRNRQMIDDHLTNLADIDVVRLDNGSMKWINCNSLVDPNEFEKVHSGGSSD